MLSKEQMEQHLKEIEKHYKEYGFPITSKNIEEQMLKMLKEKLTFDVNTDTEVVDVGYSDYQHVKITTVKVYFGDEKITEFEV